jgi:hypothetical protein
MTRVEMRRWAYFCVAPLVSLITFHRAFTTWFQSDDFGWMSLPEWLPESGLVYTLFHPAAQGQVRVLSERVLWLVFPTVFGLNPVPYRILAFATWIVVLTFTALIAVRLTGSRMAGMFAAAFLAVNANMTRPLAWSANYNEVMCAALLLAAFYSRLTNRKLAEWISYLLAFGALETAAVYPVAATLHAVLLDRKKLRSALPLFIPAALFGLIHVVFIPKAASPEYGISVDGRIFSTLHEYWRWSVGPTRISDFTAALGESGSIATVAIAAALLMFLAWRGAKRDFIPLFSAGWFVLLLGPGLLLPNHVMDYILVPALPGIAWWGADALLRGWRAGTAARIVATALAGIYVAGMFYEAALYSEWWRARARGARAVVEGVQTAKRVHPGSVFLLQGIDDDLYQTAIRDNPFEILGVRANLIDPRNIHADPAEVTRWVIPERRAIRMVDQGTARVLAVAGPSMRDVTPIFRAIAVRGDFVDVADLRSASQLGSGWYEAESRLRWMGKSATVKLWGPESASQKLRVTGYAPRAVVPASLRFSVNGVEIGTGAVKAPDQPFAFEFGIPDALVGKDEVELKIEASRTIRPPGDARELGMAFGTFAIR